MSLATPVSGDVGLSSSARHAYANESEDDDPVSNYERDEAIFAEDPFAQNDPEPYVLIEGTVPLFLMLTEYEIRISFKRKQKQPARFSISNVFSGSGSSTSHIPAASLNQDANLNDWSNFADDPTAAATNGGVGAFKEDGPLDWYVEGPGRRLAYDDMTAIDWVFEYTKERQRKRLLFSTGQGVLGHLRQLLDGSHVWVVLVATGIAVGLLAAGIDIASDWLSDIKTGYCKGEEGFSQFYLNRGFCCWGHEGNPQVEYVCQSTLTNIHRFCGVFGMDTMEKGLSGNLCWRRLRGGVYPFYNICCMSRHLPGCQL